MFAGMLAEVGLLLVAIAVLVAVLAMARRLQSITAKVGAVSLTATTLSEIREDVRHINKAVNNSPIGSPTLLQRVIALEDGQRWEHDSLRRIAHSTGVPLSPSPSERRSVATIDAGDGEPS